MQLMCGRASLRGCFAIFMLIMLGAVSALAQESGSDQKLSWNIQSSGVISRLSTVFFIDRQHGWIAGSNGTLLQTENGGLKWRRLSIPDAQKRELLRDAWFFTGERACLLGEYGQISRRNPQEAGERVFMLLNQKQDAAWIEGQPARLPVESSGKASDKGNEVRRSPDPLLLRLYFVNERVGWACGEGGMIQVTSDGGATWEIQATPTRKLLYDLMGLNDKEAWIVGAGGTLLYTSDGGQHWGLRESGVSETLRAVHFVDPKHGWAVGAHGTIISTTDGGDNWKKQNSGFSQTLNDLFFVSPTEGWVAGDRGILLYTRNGGQTWDDVPIGTNANLSRLFFISPDCGWVVGSNGSVFKYGSNE